MMKGETVWAGVAVGIVLLFWALIIMLILSTRKPKDRQPE